MGSIVLPTLRYLKKWYWSGEMAGACLKRDGEIQVAKESGSDYDSSMQRHLHDQMITIEGAVTNAPPL